MAERTEVIKAFVSKAYKLRLQELCIEREITESEYIREAVATIMRRDTRKPKQNELHPDRT